MHVMTEVELAKAALDFIKWNIESLTAPYSSLSLCHCARRIIKILSYSRLEYYFKVHILINHIVYAYFIMSFKNKHTFFTFRTKHHI